MPVCLECGRPVSSLFTEYSKGNIRLTQCEHCEKFADKYIEHDFVVIFIDMLLHKPQVYRHLLFNRIDYCDHGLDANVFKLGILLILFDVYVKYFRLEKYHDYLQNDTNIFGQYLYILSLCLLEFLLVHVVVRVIVARLLRGCYAIVKFNYISMALILSSFAKLLLILMIIWDYMYELQYSWLVNILVLTSNAEALSVFLEMNYFYTFAIMSFTLLARVVFQVLVHAVDPSMPIWIF